MPILQEHFVYMTSNSRRTVYYIGITNNLKNRIHKHINKNFENSFTKKYNVDELIYFESHPSKQSAAKREKELKGWNRNKKIKLIKTLNPELKNLSINWYFTKPTRDPSLRSG